MIGAHLKHVPERLLGERALLIRAQLVAQAKVVAHRAVIRVVLHAHRLLETRNLLLVGLDVQLRWRKRRPDKSGCMAARPVSRDVSQTIGQNI